MRFSFIVLACNFLILCWCIGGHFAAADAARAQDLRELPYASIMADAVDGLRAAGEPVTYPAHLPPLIACDICLHKSEAFGAFTENEVVVPSSLDIATLEGRSILIHEYGHFLLTRAGVPGERQEKLCLMLGNSVFRKFFMVANTNVIR